MAASPEMAALIAADDDLLDRASHVTSWQHEAPDRPFSTGRAHQAWQRHASCLLSDCARKRAACRVLAEAGLITLDERAARALR